MPKSNLIRCEGGAVEITAAQHDDNGNESGPPKFEVTAYTGGAMIVAGYDRPIVVDLEGLQYGNSLVANLDHDRTKRVGNVTSKVIDGGRLVLGGVASAATESRREVVESANNGFVWQASVEVSPRRIDAVGKNKTVQVNGQSFSGPLYVARQGVLKGFAFVSHGADDNTTVSIAASANNNEGEKMDEKLKAWIEGLGFDPTDLSDEQIANLEADFKGRSGKREPAPRKVNAGNDPFESRRLEAQRRQEINEIAARMIDMRGEAITPEDCDEIQSMTQHAIDKNMTPVEFRLELQDAMYVPQRTTVIKSRNRGDEITSRVIEAAIAQTGRLGNYEDRFSEQELDAAHKQFRNGIGLKQLILLCAEANGYKASYASDITEDVLRFAFGKIHASQGYSNLEISTILSNNANKFVMDGWNAVDMTPLRLAAVRSVRDFKQITTVSLTGDLTFEQVGKDGQIKHGTLGEETYTNKADTYARMLAITRQDIINDDMGALTSVPRKLGRGAALKLNDIFWTEFLDNSTFFTSGRGNVSTDTGALGLTGLEEADTIFMNQNDPDGNPLLITPAILLVPTALKSTARQLMESEKIKGNTDEPEANIWRGRFRTESSPYMSNANYTGNSSVAWYLLADPNDMPVIEIAALNGRVEPVIETADADFSTLGVQMRGYSDVGVSKQEYRAGVRADGSAAG